MAAYYLKDAISELIALLERKIKAEEKLMKFTITQTVRRENGRKREQSIRYIGFKEGRIHVMKQVLQALEIILKEGNIEEAFTEDTPKKQPK